ncbi:MAG: TspO protein [Candidatus Nealsonbacteria bacterium RIFOXYB1_FULL_40_15]|uniref:TspO protein n=2 Tax=Candidatus Nealsoniibacteriota TaxID=1817911 RepID=A0A1G2ESS2_9BACT|nr:MAG: TspO protein [Candidatus Nealsonbacteria bacterium RIFOXYB1_FULL_40_15]OGZ28390.1 MAG: TspO protein [Candidatus Nealsonbacteria bacterium RIFOXYC1_FULL_40_7]OGZ29515.1 MAG: TspO protein [Candidatus Nealsonbacteria bacterium RIFOXYD1_FULL_39_11]
MKTKIIKFIVSLAIPQIAGLAGAFFTASSVKTWYQELQRPSLVPPDWTFGVVWTILFILMGIAFYLIWKKNAKNAMILFFVQLFFNFLWSVIFFGLKSPSMAFIDLIVLWILVLLTIIYFYKASRPAAILLIPYILWISFAGYLNLFIWILN